MSGPASKLADVSDEQLLQAIRDTGSNVGAAKRLGVSEQSIRRALKSRDLELDRVVVTQTATIAEPASFTVKGDIATIVTEASPEDLGEVEELIRSRKLNPDEWVIEHVTINQWQAMTSDKATGDNRVLPMRQLKVVLKRKLTWMMLSPAVYVPPVKRTGRIAKGDGTLWLIEADHHVPFHDQRLHEASLKMLSQVQPHNQAIIGDVLDFSTISRHNDHPSTADATPQVCINVGHRVLRDKREASPNTIVKKLEGNHDARLDTEQLARAERIFGLCPADEDLPALSLRRLLHFDELGIELITSPRGWQHAEIEIVPGKEGLVGRHGWLTGTNTADRSMKKRGRSLIVAHQHRRELTYWWDPSMECERVGAVIGCMCLVRDDRHPHYAPCDAWTQGCAMVTTWDDGSFIIEHMPWDGKTLRWRKERWTA